MVEKSDDFGIIAAVDGSPDSDGAVRWATREAMMHGVALTLMHVVPAAPARADDPGVLTLIDRWLTSTGEEVLADARDVVAKAAAGEPMPEIHCKLDRYNTIASLARASGRALMVVVGSRGRGPVGRGLLGSVSAGLCQHASCPVVVTHQMDGAEAPDADKPVLLGIDGSPASETATAIAFDEASRRRVDLIALHAWSDVGVLPLLGMDWHTYQDEGEEVLAERLAGWQERYPDVKIQRRLVCDRPAHWLVEEASNSQLVVVGSHGRGGFAGMLLGSVSIAVAEAAPVPVVVAR